MSYPYVRTVTTWRFFLARGTSEIPFGVEKMSFDDSEWPLIDTPSTWQTEGYNLPQNLIYDYPERLVNETEKREQTISDRYMLQSSGPDDDEVGIYRASIVLGMKTSTAHLYMETSGICGSFKVLSTILCVLLSCGLYQEKAANFRICQSGH